jgi:hypothetical protein
MKLVTKAHGWDRKPASRRFRKEDRILVEQWISWSKKRNRQGKLLSKLVLQELKAKDTRTKARLERRIDHAYQDREALCNIFSGLTLQMESWGIFTNKDDDWRADWKIAR